MKNLAKYCGIPAESRIIKATDGYGYGTALQTFLLPGSGCNNHISMMAVMSCNNRTVLY
jgi:hypothetical protein